MCHFQCHFLKCTSQGLRVYQQYLKIKEFLLASTFIVHCKDFNHICDIDFYEFEVLSLYYKSFHNEDTDRRKCLENALIQYEG